MCNLPEKVIEGNNRTRVIEQAAHKKYIYLTCVISKR